MLHLPLEASNNILLTILVVEDKFREGLFISQKSIELVQTNGTVRRTLKIDVAEPGVIALHPQRRYVSSKRPNLCLQLSTVSKPLSDNGHPPTAEYLIACMEDYRILCICVSLCFRPTHHAPICCYGDVIPQRVESSLRSSFSRQEFTCIR